MQSENLPSDSTMTAGGSRYAGCSPRVPAPSHCLPAVYNNDDAAYRELHFAMSLTGRRSEEPLKLLVVERQIRLAA